MNTTHQTPGQLTRCERKGAAALANFDRCAARRGERSRRAKHWERVLCRTHRCDRRCTTRRLLVVPTTGGALLCLPCSEKATTL